MDAPDFVLYLGLGADADDQAIRRAYAFRLKQIDQITQAEAFQILRQAYDAARYWAAAKLHEAESRAPEPVLTGEAAHQAKPETDKLPTSAWTAAELQETRQQRLARAESEARAVLDGLISSLQGNALTNCDDAEILLHFALDDPALMDMDARYYFEWGVAALLASGWRAGHEYLFERAAEHFKWSEERTRLFSFGRAGYVIDAAIVELEMHQSQVWAEQASQRDLVQKLRLNHRPANKLVISQLPLVETLAQTYPNWLRVVTNTENIAQWQEWHRQIPGWQRWIKRRSAQRKSTTKPQDEIPRGLWRTLWMVSAAAAFIAFIGHNGSAPSRADRSEVSRYSAPGLSPPSVNVLTGADSYLYSFAREAQPLPGINLGADRLFIMPPPLQRTDAARSYGQAIRDAVLPNIVYGGTPSGNPEAEVTIELARDGQIKSRSLSKPSGDASWDRAVLRAIDRITRLPVDEHGLAPPTVVIGFRPKG